MDASEYKRRNALVRQWCKRGYQFLRKELKRYGVEDLRELPEHPRFTEVLTRVYDALLDKNWKWYFVLKLRSFGISYEDIVTKLYDLLWDFWVSKIGKPTISREEFMKKSPDIFWPKTNGGGENGDEPE